MINLTSRLIFTQATIILGAVAAQIITTTASKRYLLASPLNRLFQTNFDCNNIKRIMPISVMADTTTNTFSVPATSSTTKKTQKCISDSRPVVISGPSGVGKGTLCKLLLERHPTFFATTVSHTTRSPRPCEIDGYDYYFISRQEFEALIERNAFVEHAQFGGNRYGTSKETIDRILKDNRIPVLDIEMEGVKQIKESKIPARFLFIAPPSMEILEKRLRGRKTETEESIQKRLAQAQNEIEFAATERAHDITIVNDDLEQAYVSLENFIFGDK